MDIGEIVYTITIIILNADNEWTDPITFNLVDGNIPCSVSDVACTKKYDNHFVVWIDINDLWQKDSSCGRNPIEHEFFHIRHWGKAIHNNCELN